MLACFAMIVAIITRFILTKVKPYIIIITMDESIPNIQLMCLKFSVETFNLSCFCKGGQEKVGKQLHCRLILETIIGLKYCKIKDIKHEMKNMSHHWL